MSWWNQWFVICHMFVCSVHSLAPEHCGATPGSGLLWVLLHPSTANGWSSFWSRHPPQLSGQWGEKEFINKPNQSVSSGGFILFFKALLSLEVAVIYKAVLNWCRSTVIISPLLVRYLFAHYFFWLLFRVTCSRLPFITRLSPSRRKKKDWMEKRKDFLFPVTLSFL